MNKHLSLFLMGLLLVTSKSFSQTTLNKLLWSPTHKLTVDDFSIKTKQLETTISFAQFSIDYESFGFFTKNFNNKVRNWLIKSASWIDTTIDVNLSLRYQQSLFDISEIYVRQLRCALKKNRKKLLSGNKIVDELNTIYMAAFAQRRIDYDRETKFGSDESKQMQWEKQIQNELLQWNNYAYDK